MATSSRYPLSAVQERLWLAEKLLPGTALQLVRTAWRLHGDLDISALDTALRRVVARHPGMQVHIEESAGRAWQIVPSESPVRLDVEEVHALPGEAQPAAERRVAAEVLNHPLDITAGPLVRVVLIRADDEEFILCVVAHHVIWDGISTDIFARELGEQYEAALSSFSTVSGGPGRSFLDVLTPAGTPLGLAQEADLEWWRGRYEPLPPVLSLGSGTHSSLAAQEVPSTSLWLGPELSARLRALARASRVTVFMAALAGFAALMSRMTGQWDVAIAVPVSGRTEADTEQMIGLFVQTLPFRVAAGPDETFAHLMERVRTLTLEAMAHQSLPYSAFVQSLPVEHQGARDPVCSVAFESRRYSEGHGLELRGLDVSPSDSGSPPSTYGLTVTVDDHGDDLLCHISWDPAFCDDVTATRLPQRYRMLLESGVNAPDTMLRDLTILDRDEQELLLNQWSGRTVVVDSRACVHELVQCAAAAAPDAVAIEDGSRRVTYADLIHRARLIASCLRGHGVASGAVVGLHMGRSADTVITMLGVLMVGAAYLPLDTEYPEARLRRMVALAGVKLVLTSSDRVLDLGPDSPVLVTLTTVQREASLLSEGDTPAGVDPGDPAYVIFTSGSTGEPKGVIVPHRAIAQLVLDRAYWDGDAGDCVAHMSTISFDAATFEIWGALTRGARLVVIDRDTMLSPGSLGETFKRHRVTTAFFTTSLFNMLACEAPTLFAGLRLVLFGGEAANPAAVRSVIASGPPQRLLNMYGPTETTTFALWHEVRGVPADAVTVPVGRPVAGAAIWVLDASGGLVPPGVPGELYIGGGGLALGYVGDQALTSCRFSHDPRSRDPAARLYRTGDGAMWRPDGTIELLGRLDEQVKLRGFRIEPGEVVSALERLAAVRQAAVMVREDTPGDRRLVAYVVPVEGTVLDAEAMAGALREVLPAFMIPAAFVEVPGLPRTPAGKLDMRALPAPVPVGGTAAGVLPRSQAELLLLRVWRQVLGRQDVGPDDDFFALGGTSLVAVRLAAEVERRIGVRLPLSMLFTAPTVRAMARSLSTEGWTPDWSCLVPIHAAGSLPPVFCVHGWGNEVLGMAALARELGEDQPFYGLQAKGLDGRSEPLGRVEDMAAVYVQEVRSMEPVGPYYLLGYSMGGAVAFEMAQELQKAGCRVAFLGIIDAGFPGSVEPQGVPLYRRLKLHVRAITRRRPVDAVRYFHHRVLSLWRKAVTTVRPRPQARTEPATDPRTQVHERVQRANDAAWTAYVPQVWNGAATMFANTTKETIWEDSRMVWKRVIAGGLTVIRGRGTHVSILSEPDVAGLAAAIRVTLARARTQSEACP